MKDYYTIGEISNLYGIGADSLRYYEKMGAVSPGRGENGYRYYSLKEIYKLNIIRDLLSLGFSMQQITDYLKNQNLDATKELLAKELERIRSRRKELAQMEDVIQNRLERLDRFSVSLLPQEALPDGELYGAPQICSYPRRFCLRMDQEAVKDEELDFLITKLYRTCEANVRDFCNHTRGAFMRIKDLQQGKIGLYHGAFFLLKEGETGGNYILPRGAYLTMLYRGDYSQLPRRIEELFRFAQERGLTLKEEVLELYQVDNHDTSEPSEYVTQLQVYLGEDYFDSI